MYRRLLIVSGIVFTALAAFAVLGFHSISLHADGLAGKRIGAFSEVAEQIRLDVNRKLKNFILTEEKRPYTHYQNFYAPEVVNNGFNNEGNVFLPSPLAKANTMTHGMAYGHFQIEPDGTIVLPNYADGQNEKLDSERISYISNLKYNVLANSLKADEHSAAYLRNKQKELAQKIAREISLAGQADKIIADQGKAATKKAQLAKAPQQNLNNSRAEYDMDVLQKERNQKAQIFIKPRNLVNAELQSKNTSNGSILSQSNQSPQQAVAKGSAANNQLRSSPYFQQYGRQSAARYRRDNDAAQVRVLEKPSRGGAQNRKPDTAAEKTETSKDIRAGGGKTSGQKEYQPKEDTPLIVSTEQRSSLENKRFEYDDSFKFKDAYDESLKSAEEKHKSDSRDKFEKKVKSDTTAVPEVPNTKSGRSNPTKSVRVDILKDKFMGVADFEGYSETQRVPNDVLAPRPADKQLALPAEDFSGTSTLIDENTAETDSLQELTVQGGAFYTYEQMVKNAIAGNLIPGSGWQDADDMVQIRVGPFASINVNSAVDKDSYFGSQVFLLRHVQIEDNHFIQGFKLNEAELIYQIKESALRLVRTGMGFELSKNESPDAAHAAILVFDFGQLVLNLMELKPQWIANQVSHLKRWYLAIVTVVLIATLLAMISLWRNLNAQTKLARKKDDFISAVSHELRTPLTTIRMYTEMLEKNWVKTEGKRTEYYGTMRQESERLTRLVENVLDFSRIQRGKKRYNFALGDINSCIKEVVEMMAPCAAKQNFKIETHLDPAIQSTSFDNDAVMQIVINLIDNALKYAADAEDKTIIVRTATEGKYVLIEVADHGPGIPHTQRKKIFDEFYRIGEESRRETTGTGLGLALVKRFADAHNGFVEAISAKPNGALLRVAISTTIA